MAFSPFDSAIYRKLYGDDEIAKLFSDSSEVRAMLLVEGMLAKAQGELGIIPKDSAFFIHRSSMELQVDPAGLADGVGSSGVPVPALVDAFRKAMEAPDHAQYVHWGATSQDIVDTALVLRLRQFLAIIDQRLETLIGTLTAKAFENRDVVMAARTRSQIATPTTLGAKIAGWITPLHRHQERLAELRKRLLVVSLAGASSNYAAFGEKGFEIEAALAEELKLEAPESPWHSARDNFAELASVLSLINGSLGKIGQDIQLLTQTEVAEITVAGGGSSTMPHKSNPVLAELLIMLARNNANLVGQMHGALLHSHERDGAAWAMEWHTLPQICVGCGTALSQASTLTAGIQPNQARMHSNIALTHGFIMAEAAMFALAEHMTRPEAQELVKSCCTEASQTNRHLRDVLEEKSPVSLDWDQVFDPTNYTGLATQLVDRLKC